LARLVLLDLSEGSDGGLRSGVGGRVLLVRQKSREESTEGREIVELSLHSFAYLLRRLEELT